MFIDMFIDYYSEICWYNKLIVIDYPPLTKNS